MKSETKIEDSHAFVVRFWLEPREIEEKKSEWRGMIEHVQSGKRIYLTNLAEVRAFIESFLTEMNGNLKLPKKM